MTEGPLTALGQLRYISIHAIFTAEKKSCHERLDGFRPDCGQLESVHDSISGK